MIFVTIGTLPFIRLIKKMDEIAGKIDEEVIMQIGNTEYNPKNAKYFTFIANYQEIQELNQKARIVVCHAGVGSILTALKYVTPIVAVPRRKEYNEHFNDHQLELGRKLEQDGKIKIVWEVDKLEESLKAIEKLRVTDLDSDTNLVDFVKAYIRGLGE